MGWVFLLPKGTSQSMKQKASVLDHRPPQDHGEPSSPKRCPRALLGDGHWAHQPPSPPTLSVWVLPSLPFCKMLSVFMGRGWWGWSHKCVIINLRTMRHILLIRKVDIAGFLWRHHKGRVPPEIMQDAAREQHCICFAERLKSSRF